METNPKELSKPGPFERGPADFVNSSRASGIQDDRPDPSILNSIQARLWKSSPFAEPVLALEVVYGAYKGVVFAFSSFEVLPMKMENGMVPTRFETKVFIEPAGFVKDETFDLFCSEVLLSWMNYIATNDIQPLVKQASSPGIH